MNAPSRTPGGKLLSYGAALHECRRKLPPRAADGGPVFHGAVWLCDCGQYFVWDEYLQEWIRRSTWRARRHLKKAGLL